MTDTAFFGAGGSHAFRAALLAWYARGHRAMPWRDTADPYRIWLAETMLQQTTVAAVVPYYARFLARFPTLAALAAADIQDVLALWQGLGYYRRAHLLHACARTVMTEHGGHFPATEDSLRALPGFGPYTAAVVAACAFGQPANVVDGNVERVVARVFRHLNPLPRAKPVLRAHAATLVDGLAAGAEATAYANAIMELGSQVCVPKAPLCMVCPVAAFCAAHAHGDAADYPRKDRKKETPTKRGIAWVLRGPANTLLLRQRPARGLLGGLWEVPHHGWEPARWAPPADTPAQDAGTVTHVFSHFRLELEVRVAELEAPAEAGQWFGVDHLPPLSTLMRKVVDKALAS